MYNWFTSLLPPIVLDNLFVKTEWLSSSRLSVVWSNMFNCDTPPGRTFIYSFTFNLSKESNVFITLKTSIGLLLINLCWKILCRLYWNLGGQIFLRREEDGTLELIYCVHFIEGKKCAKYHVLWNHCLLKLLFIYKPVSKQLSQP